MTTYYSEQSEYKYRHLTWLEKMRAFSCPCTVVYSHVSCHVRVPCTVYAKAPERKRKKVHTNFEIPLIPKILVGSGAVVRRCSSQENTCVGVSF